jgi:hypothetical protein
MYTEEPLIPASNPEISLKRKSGVWQMWLIVIIFAAPVIASYVMFYIVKPTGGKTNYGQLVYPVQLAPQESLIPEVYGKWTLLIARPAQTCEKDEDRCLKLLYFMRQLRASLGKELERVQIVIINTDNSQFSPSFLQAYDEKSAGVRVFYMPNDTASKAILNQWINRDDGGQAIQLLDPNGARMMRFPVSPDAPDFKKMRADVEKLLKWNPTGKHGKTY